MLNVIFQVLFWIVVAAVVLLLVLDIRRLYYVKTGDIDPDTIPRFKLTNYNYYVLLLVIVMNLIVTLRHLVIG
jgi:hypothetical protein